MIKDFETCPVCQGKGDLQNKECEFCDGYGFLTLLTLEQDSTAAEGWNDLEYTTYSTYLRGKKKHFKHATNEIVIEKGPSFFDCEGIPSEDQYVSIIPGE